jgi:hypothetical protein
VGAATADTLKPALQDLVNETWEHHAVVPLSPTAAAQAEVAGAYTATQARQDARFSGISTERMNAIRASAGNAPQLAQLLDLWNRGRISEADLEKGLRQGLTRPEWADDLKALRYRLPTGETLAQMAVQGVLSVDEAKAAAALAGTQGSAFDRLYRLAGDPIAPDEMLALWNRGEATEADVDRALRQSRLKPEWVDQFKQLRHVLAPVSDLVRFAVREVFDPAARRDLDLDAELPPAFLAAAARVGLDAEQAGQYWAAHWGLPSYTQGAAMMFRGELTEAQFGDLLKALDYAPTWRDKLASIAHAIPTLSDMIRFAQREVYDDAQRTALGLDSDYPAAFTQQAAKHGLAERDARDYWAAHWRLPSALQGYRMLWRDEISPAELDGLLKALDYPAIWRQRLANIAHLAPGRIDLKRMYAAGLKSRAELEKGYQRIGYAPADARDMAALAASDGSGAAKDLTLAHLTAEYQGQHIDRAEYLARLADLGYSEGEAQQLADLTDSKRVARARDQFVTRIHSQFVGHKITTAEAAAALDQAGVAVAARDLIMVEWDHERAVNVKRLTQAQIVKAYKKSSLSQAEAMEELTDQGLSAEEAEILLEIA